MIIHIRRIIVTKSIAEQFARSGYDIQLAARNPETLKQTQIDLEACYEIKVTIHEFDVLELNKHQEFISSLPILPEIAICAIGLLGDQSKDEKDNSQTA